MLKNRQFMTICLKYHVLSQSTRVVHVLNVSHLLRTNILPNMSSTQDSIITVYVSSPIAVQATEEKR